MKKKIVVRLCGGMGNQLYQYAYARHLQEKFGGDLVFSTFLLKKQGENDYMPYFTLKEHTYLDDNAAILYLLRIKARLFLLSYTYLFRYVMSEERFLRIQAFFGVYMQLSTRFVKQDYASNTQYKFLVGYFFSEKFFSDVINLIQDEIKIKRIFIERNDDLEKNLKNCNSVCVHIRRGDYLNDDWASKLLVCNKNYYRKGIDLIRKEVPDSVFYVFSNSKKDVEFIQANWNLGSDIKYVNFDNKDIEDFQLMSSCKHFIISNSTFSWWVSYLAENEGKIVVSPKKWNTGIWNVDDLFLDSWRLVDND